MSPQRVFFKEVTPEILKKAEEELNETPEIKEEALNEFRRLIKEHDYIHCSMEDEFLLKFLRCKKFNVQKSLNILLNYISLQQKYCGVYTCRSTSELRDLFKMKVMFVQPYRMKDLSHIGHVRLAGFDPSGDAVEKLVACVLHFANMSLEYEVSQICGIHVIVDFAGTTFQQYRAFVSYSLLRFMISCLQDCIPLRMRGIHFVNEPYFVHTVYQVFKHLGTKKLIGKMHFHGNDYSTLHEIIPTEYLPEWLGGTASPVDNDELESFFCSHEYLIEEWKKHKIEVKT